MTDEEIAASIKELAESLIRHSEKYSLANPGRFPTAKSYSITMTALLYAYQSMAVHMDDPEEAIEQAKEMLTSKSGREFIAQSRYLWTQIKEQLK